MKKFKLDKYARKSLISLKSYKSAREECLNNDRKMILLDANENPFDSETNRYPDPMQLVLKKNISKWKKVPIENIYLSNGSDEFISQFIFGFCEPGIDKIIINPPTFLIYRSYAELHGIDVFEIPLIDDFQLNVIDILKTNKLNFKIIFIPSPNNPTGNSFSENDLLKIIQNFNGLVVLDEAYIEFSKNGSLVSLIKKYPNLIVCQTFSKAQGMAGSRLGMAFANHEIINFLNQIKAPYNLNTLSQKRAIERLQNQKVIKSQVKIIISERVMIKKEFNKIKFIKLCYPTDANFFLIKVDNSKLRYIQLLDKGIVVRDSSKNLFCDNTLRITIGTPKENKILIHAMRQIDNKK
jgi:histidinol-phosphate aminotransferase